MLYRSQEYINEIEYFNEEADEEVDNLIVRYNVLVEENEQLHQRIQNLKIELEEKNERGSFLLKASEMWKTLSDEDKRPF